MELDETHRALLEALRQDGRISVTALAERVGISRANAYARLVAMEQAGVIEGFHARVNPAAVGKSVAALVFVSLWQSQWADFRSRLAGVPELEYFAVTTGQLDAMLLVRSEDVGGIHAFVVDDLTQWPSVKSTETVFLMDEQHFDFSLGPAGRTPLRAQGEHGATRFVSAPPSRKRPSR